MQARAVQHQQAQQHVQSQQQLPPLQQQQQPHSHAHQQQLQQQQQQQQTQSQNTEQMRQGISSGVRLHTRMTPPESPALENATAGPSRQNSSGIEETRASLAVGENVSSHVLSSKEQETAQPGNQTLMPPSTRVGSRFGWSNPNSWASKVAGGGAKGGNAGVPSSTSINEMSKRQEMAE
jgi:hypothetical protein